jgi:hypothetical protein
MSLFLFGIIVIIGLGIYGAYKAYMKRKEDEKIASVVRILDLNDGKGLLFFLGLVFLGFIIYAYVVNINPTLVQMRELYGKLNYFDENSINELLKKESIDKKSRLLDWSIKKLYWRADNKEIRYSLKTNYFNNNLLYTITVEPFDDRFSYSTYFNINIEDDDFTLFNINTRNWEKYSDSNDVQIGFIAKGKVPMVLEEYIYLIENKNKLDWKLINY